VNLDLAGLRERMESSDPEERRRALARVGAGEGSDVLALLVVALGDDHWRVRKEAVAWLVGASDPAAAARAVVPVLASTDDVGQRNSAIEALTKLGSPAVAPLVEALSDTVPHRKFLIDALGAVADGSRHDAVASLVRSLADEDVNVRVAAAEALGGIGGPRATDALLDLIDSDDMMVQLTALDALAALDSRISLEKLAKALETPVVRCSALRLLGGSHDEKAFEILLGALTDKTRRAREAAVEALARLDRELVLSKRKRLGDALRATGDEQRRRIGQALDARDTSTRLAAAHLAGLTGYAEYAERLSQLLLDSQMAGAAGNALVALGRAADGELATLERGADEPLRSEIAAVRSQIAASALPRASSPSESDAAGAAPSPPRAAGKGARGKRKLDAQAFKSLREIIYDHCGIYFKDDNSYLMQRRLAPRLDAAGCADFAAYADLLRGPGGAAELAEAVERITTNETYFFRESYQLYAFADEIVPELFRARRRGRRLNVWSAGCSTGEEPYTIAMLVRERGELDNWDVRVVGSDISKRVLEVARRGWYGRSSMRAIDPSEYRRFFRPSNGGHEVTDEARELVEFRPTNLLDRDQVEPLPHFDVIFCRNVLIYFDRRAREKVVDTFYDQLVPGGYLLLGHSESLINLSTKFDIVQLQNDTVYRKPL